MVHQGCCNVSNRGGQVARCILGTRALARGNPDLINQLFDVNRILHFSFGTCLLRINNASVANTQQRRFRHVEVNIREIA